MIRYLTCSFLIFFSINLFAQSLPNRYQEEIFTNWSETSDVLFSTNVPQPKAGGGFYEFITGYPLNVDEFDTEDVNLYMDIFQPTGDTLSQRPLVIICFGGGFLAGSKDHWSIRLLAEQLAKRGFVTATIEYRLGMNIFDADLSNRAVYRGIQDGRAAVRFFREDAAGANTYKIDPDQIFMGGHSAGAFIATHNAYLDKESERPLSTFVWSQESTNDCADLGCLDCAGDNQEYSGRANAIFSLSGALGFTDFIESADDPHMVMFHSTDDGTVPYTSGQPFSDLLWLVVGSDLPDVYGSSTMADQADAVGLPYEFHTYTNRGHGVHENDPELYDDIIPRTEDWFYQDRLKPTGNMLVGDSTICNDEAMANYMTTEISSGYYDWALEGESSYIGSNSDHEIIVDWDTSSMNAKVSLIPYSKWRARGDSLHIEISFQDHETITWISTNGNWTDSSNWTLLRNPQTCDEVILPTQSEVYTVTTPADLKSTIRTLITYPGTTFELEPGAELLIRGDRDN